MRVVALLFCSTRCSDFWVLHRSRRVGKAVGSVSGEISAINKTFLNFYAKYPYESNKTRKCSRFPHSPHAKPVSFRTFDTTVSRQDLCLSTMDDVSAGPRATEGPSPWHRRRVVGRESVGCFMIRCIFRAYGSGKWRRGTLFYTDPCVLFLNVFG